MTHGPFGAELMGTKLHVKTPKFGNKRCHCGKEPAWNPAISKLLLACSILSYLIMWHRVCMKCLTSLNVKAFAGSCGYNLAVGVLPALARPFWSMSQAGGFHFLLLPFAFFSCLSSQNWDCWEKGCGMAPNGPSTRSPLPSVCDTGPELWWRLWQNSPLSWRGAGAAWGRAGAPQGRRETDKLPQDLQVSTHLPLPVFYAALLPAAPVRQTPAVHIWTQCKPLPKHNFPLPACAFLKERDEAEQPTRGPSQACCLMQDQKVLKSSGNFRCQKGKGTEKGV